MELEALRLYYPLDNRSLVVDLGVYEGKFTREIRQRYGCAVLGFEPVREFWSKLADLHADPCVSIRNCAIGAEDGTAKIAVRNDSSSLYLEGECVEPVQVVGVAKLFATLTSIGHWAVDLMKINVEGAEYDILDRMIELDLVRRVRFLQIQFHTYGAGAEGAQVRRDRIRESLRQTHTLEWDFPFVWESWRRTET